MCGKLIQKKVVQFVNSADCFSILGDETFDVSGKEQFPLCIRYIVNENKPILKAFTHIIDLSVESIYETSVGLNMDKVIGQGNNGCPTFSRHLPGVSISKISGITPQSYLCAMCCTPSEFGFE